MKLMIRSTTPERPCQSSFMSTSSPSQLWNSVGPNSLSCLGKGPPIGLKLAFAICDRRYGLKKLADKNFRELIYGVNLHTKPGKHYDGRIALFSALCGMTEMEDWSPNACGAFAKLHSEFG